MTISYRIHYTLNGTTEDSVVVTGNTIEEIREKAASEVTRRGGTDPWSESV